MTVAVLGTAHLFGVVPPARSGPLLNVAHDVGFRAFDTAPLYGHGRSEAALGERLARWSTVQLTSKVGLEPAPAGSGSRRVATSVARRVPTVVRRRLGRPGGRPRGAFEPDLLRRSLDRTLARLGHVDRLLLHEAHAEDLTDEALDVLAGYRRSGDVGEVGVATSNEATVDVAVRAPDLVTTANVEIGPFAPRVELPATVTSVVGHGVLGPAGRALQLLAAAITTDRAPARHWREVTADTRWDGVAGLADALVARAAGTGVTGVTGSTGVTGVIVATSRPDRLGNLRELAAGEVQLGPDVGAALAGLVVACRPAHA